MGKKRKTGEEGKREQTPGKKTRLQQSGLKRIKNVRGGTKNRGSREDRRTTDRRDARQLRHGQTKSDWGECQREPGVEGEEENGAENHKGEGQTQGKATESSEKGETV